jgi:RNA polymerase sigma-70 factor, ECF subfamily
MADPVDGKWIARCQQGDLHAFARLFDHFQDRVYDLAFAILQDHADAEDVLQDTFLRVFEKIDSFRGGSRFETWLVAIAVNACRDRLRRRRLRRFIPLAQLSPRRLAQLLGFGRDPAAVVAGRQEQESLWDLVDELDDRLRLPLILRYYYGLSCAEVAEALGLTTGTVYGQLSDGRRYLRQRLAAPESQATAVRRSGGELC